MSHHINFQICILAYSSLAFVTLSLISSGCYFIFILLQTRDLIFVSINWIITWEEYLSNLFHKISQICLFSVLWSGPLHLSSICCSRLGVILFNSRWCIWSLVDQYSLKSTINVFLLTNLEWLSFDLL